MKKFIKALWHELYAGFETIIGWIAALFGMKDGSKYGRVLHRIIGTAFAVVVIFWAATTLVRFGRSIYSNFDSVFDFGDNDSYFSEQVSDDISYYDGFYGHYGYLKNSDGKKVLKHITSISMPMDGDSLVYFSDGDKRGYFNMRDGKVVIKPKYEHAWIFSEGLAAVEVNGRIKFINTEGEVVIDKGFAYDVSDDGYVFHDGHCAVNDHTGKHKGLIDRNGEWVIKPEYEHIAPFDNFWLIRNEGEEAIISFGMDTVMPLTKVYFEFNDTAILATFADHTQSVFSLQGELITASQIRDVEQMLYETHEVLYPVNNDGIECTDEYYSYSNPAQRMEVANCMRYEAERGWYGLMSADGRLITPPSYVNIRAVGKDLYLCETDYGRGVILNSKGVRMK